MSCQLSDEMRGSTGGANCYDCVDDRPGDISLGSEVDLDRLRVGPQHRNRICLVSEANPGGAHVVRNDEIEPFALELVLGMVSTRGTSRPVSSRTIAA